jgi:hypothetical protein
VSNLQLSFYGEAAGITMEDTVSMSRQEIQEAYRQSYRELWQKQKMHRELRETYLEQLAEAIVLERAPHLNQDSMQTICHEQVEKQVKQLISCKKRRKIYRKLGALLGKLSGKGLSRVDVPDASATNPQFGDLTNPKKWTGPWKSITDPIEIAHIITKITSVMTNITRYMTPHLGLAH